MSEQTITTERRVTHDTTCDPATSATKSLLAYGAIAGPIYVSVSLAQVLTRDGFDPTRHGWSLLANGDWGWIQTANLVVTGLMMIAFAVGMRRSLRPGRGAAWAPRLIGVYGAGMVGAGAFRADPALGFPTGTPDGPGDVSWHGMLHFVSAGFGFLCLVVACLVVASRFAAEGRRGWAAFSRFTGVAFLAGFVGVASGAGNPVINLAFTAAVVLAWVWVSAVAARRYRLAAHRYHVAGHRTDG